MLVERAALTDSRSPIRSLGDDVRLDLGPELEAFRRELGDWIEDNRAEGLEDVDERAMYLGTAELAEPEPGVAR
ncbi:MAG TPA: hypothetical protein VGL32_11275 [Acidimicrobiales bacterium]|jgi:hypothetical protein